MCLMSLSDCKLVVYLFQSQQHNNQVLSLEIVFPPKWLLSKQAAYYLSQSVTNSHTLSCFIPCLSARSTLVRTNIVLWPRTTSMNVIVARTVRELAATNLYYTSQWKTLNVLLEYLHLSNSVFIVVTKTCVCTIRITQRIGKSMPTII